MHTPWKTATLVLALATAMALTWMLLLADKVGYFRPFHNKPGTLVHRLNAIADETAQLRHETGALAEADARLRNAVNEAASLSAIFPRDGDPASLVPLIRDLAQKSGVLPRRILSESFPLDGGIGKDMLTAWRYSLFIAGTFDQLASFINSLEQSDQSIAVNGRTETPFFEIRDMNITGRSPSEEKNAAGYLHLCTLTVYAYRPAAEWLNND